jgi:hypothetical protein
MPYSNPYTQVVIDEWRKNEKEPEFLTAEDRMALPATHVKAANNMNRTWGPWEILCKDYDGTVYYILRHEAGMYDIDLNDISTTGDILSWLIHMSGKCETFYGESFVYFLGCAFSEILEHSGLDIKNNQMFDGKKVAAKYYKDLRPKRSISSRTRHLVFERDKFRCRDCGASATTGATLELDHTIPISKGGSNEISNLRTLCSDCNRGKSDRIVQYD